MKRNILAVIGLALAMLGVSSTASASTPIKTMAPADHIVLSGNGEAWYLQSTDEIRIRDLKDGDHMYVKYGFTNCDFDDGCGRGGNADRPGTEYTARNAQAHQGYRQDHPVNPRGRYIVIKLCNDDFPPDTCTNWKRAFN